MYAHARPAIHAETDGSLEPSVSAPINPLVARGDATHPTGFSSFSQEWKELFS